ncbi:type IX secretion system protein PorD [Robiginitalea sp. IMCC44478]|uniref:type IX secretion system protein PorD n=1 Tax=Robiginitalea sp. IMCC44478 TaxID=3459122 RepID=UPI004042199A
MKFISGSTLKTSLLAVLLLLFLDLGAQELNCTVTVNADQVSQTNQQVFTTLERSLTDFVNKTRWTRRQVKENERLNCRIFITVTAFESSRFEANIQLQSSRPVFNTSYETPVFNYKDDQFNFQYIEFQPLVFNENVFNSNLVGVISYYVYIMLGLDADTFQLEGGTDHFKKAQAIVTQAQGSNFAGWGQTASDNRTRFQLVDNLLSNTFREYRIAMYNYHRKGLDVLADNNSTGKQIIAGSLRLFETLIQRRPNAFLIQTFFDAKAEEIQNIFSDGPKVDIVQLKETLNKVAPFYASTWNQIKY